MSSKTDKPKPNKKFKRLIEENDSDPDDPDDVSVAKSKSSSSTSTSSSFKRKVNKIKNYFCVGNGNQKSDSDNEELEKDSEIVDNENSVSIPSSQSKLASLPSKGEKSIVWNYFISTNNGKQYKCSLCKRCLTNCNNTSNLLNHLKGKHPEIIASQSNVNDTEEDGKVVQQNNPGKPKNSSNRSVIDYFSSSHEVPKYDKNSPLKQKLDRYFAQFICNGYHALSVTEEKSFRDFIHILNPKYKVPSRKTLTATILPNLYAECRTALMECLRKANSVSITADGWTSVANDNYLGVTCHFYSSYSESDGIELISSALDMVLIEKDEKAETLAEIIRKVLVEFNILGKVSHLITDNAANMKATAELLQIRHIPCFAHTLNLVLRSALSTSGAYEEQIREIIKKCKTLVTFFHSSAKATRRLAVENEHILEDGERKPTKLVQYVDTRWHTLLKMFLSIIYNYEGIKRVSICKEYNHLLTLTDSDIEAIKELILLLQPLETATTELSGHLYVSISMVIPAVKGLFIAYQTIKQKLKTDIGKAVLENILEQIRTRLQPYETRTTTRVATLLDARFGRAGFMSESNYEYSQQALKELVKQRCEPDWTNVSSTASTSQVPTNSSDNSILNYIDSVEFVRNDTAMATTIVRNFISVMATQKIDRKQDPLLYLQVSFPELYIIALNIFSVPASSVPAESLFSKTGQIVTDRRNKLSPTNVKILTFLKYNLRFINL